MQTGSPAAARSLVICQPAPPTSRCNSISRQRWSRYPLGLESDRRGISACSFAVYERTWLPCWLHVSQPACSAAASPAAAPFVAIPGQRQSRLLDV